MFIGLINLRKTAAFLISRVANLPMVILIGYITGIIASRTTKSPNMLKPFREC